MKLPAVPAAPPLRIVLVDDETPARTRLHRLLSTMAQVQVIGEAATGMDAVRLLTVLHDAGTPPDLVLLDIQMPGLNGFGVVEAVGVDRMPPVVFQTAYDEHALRAFDVRAIDYLLKPVLPARLREAIARARGRARPMDASEQVVLRARNDHLAGLVEEQNCAQRRVLVHGPGGAALLALDDIWLARAERNYVTLHTTRGVYRVRMTMSTLAERLDDTVFLRVNRSDIVRIDAVRAMEPRTHGEYRVVLPDGSATIWSRRYRALQRDRFRFDTPDQPPTPA